jgi:tRNA pseudouridine synthase D (TruD)
VQLKSDNALFMSEAMTATVTEFCLLLFTPQCCCATGFINYFGTQRVGSVQLDAVMPHSIGKAVLQGNLAAAVKQILQPLQPSQLQSSSGSSSNSATAAATGAAAAAVPSATAASSVAASLQSCKQASAESTPDIDSEASDAYTDSCTNSSSCDSSTCDRSSAQHFDTGSAAAARAAQQQQHQHQQAQYVQPQPTAAVALLWDYLEGRCSTKSSLFIHC